MTRVTNYRTKEHTWADTRSRDTNTMLKRLFEKSEGRSRPQPLPPFWFEGWLPIPEPHTNWDEPEEAKHQHAATRDHREANRRLRHPRNPHALLPTENTPEAPQTKQRDTSLTGDGETQSSNSTSSLEYHQTPHRRKNTRPTKSLTAPHTPLHSEEKTKRTGKIPERPKQMQDKTWQQETPSSSISSHHIPRSKFG